MVLLALDGMSAQAPKVASSVFLRATCHLETDAPPLFATEAASVTLPSPAATLKVGFAGAVATGTVGVAVASSESGLASLRWPTARTLNV